MRSSLSLVIAKISASVILYDTFKIPQRAAPCKTLRPHEIDTFLMRTGRRGSGGTRERANIADSTRREVKGRKRGKEGRFEVETRARRAKTKRAGGNYLDSHRIPSSCHFLRQQKLSENRRRSLTEQRRSLGGNTVVDWERKITRENRKIVERFIMCSHRS